MRFACQSCGKAYNLPEDKIADKSNVKLKCRVCGAIVEVKRNGEVVAQLLGDVDGKRVRVSEAPAPLISMSADDADDATHAIAVGDQILSEGSADEAAAAALLGHVKSALGQQRAGLAPLPAPSPTGFGSMPLVPNFGAPSSSPFVSSSAPASFGAPPGANAFGPPPGATPIPPPLGPPEPPAFTRQDSPLSAPLPSGVGGSPPPPLPSMGAPEPMAQALGAPNGSHELPPRFADVVPLPEEPLPALAGLAPAGMAAVAAPLGEPSGGAAVEVAHGRPAGDDTTRKMLAAFATGLLIGFIIARLFF